MIVDTVLAAPDGVMMLAQAMPGAGSTMEAPPGFGPVMDRIIGGAKWIALAIAMIGGIAAAGGAALSRRQGSSEDATADFVRIGLAVAVIAGVISLIGWIFDAAGGA